MLKMILTLTMVAGIAAAGGPEPTPAKAGTKSDDRSLLAGPAVAASNVTGATSTFSSESESSDARMSMAGARLFRDALQAWRDAPEDLRPTKEQESAIAKLVRDFQQQEREFQRRHGPELRRLRAQFGRQNATTTDAQSKQDRPSTDRRLSTQRSEETDRPTRDLPSTSEPDSMMQPSMLQMDTDTESAMNPRQRVAELMAERPSFASIEKPIRALLSKQQREWIDSYLVTKSKEMFESRAMDRYRKEAAEQLAKQRTRSMDDIIKRLPDRMQAYLMSLPEEERAAAFERLRERRQSDRRPRQTPPQRTKTPPSVDDLDLPAPDSGG